MAIEVQGLEIQIGARTLLHPTNFHVAKGDKIGLVGRNGAGKTTLTRVITGDMLPTAGKVRVSGKLGYLPQDTHASDPTQTALDRMMSARDIATIINRIRKAEKDMTDPDPDVMSKAMTRYDKAMQDFDKAGGYAAQSEAISMAASLGLPQEVMEQQLGTLSGGQRRRIELARILFSNADTLILDEPTNHLDIVSKEILENALNDYTGTVLYVSHDRYFINQTASRILDLVNHTFVNYIGNYDYYLEKKEELTTAYAGAASTSSSVSDNSTDKNVSESKLSWQEQKEAQARLRKRQNELKKTEERIGQLEDRDGEIDALMVQEEIFTNSVKCQELAKEKAAIAEELEELYMKWEELAEDA